MHPSPERKNKELLTLHYFTKKKLKTNKKFPVSPYVCDANALKNPFVFAPLF